MLHKLSMAFLSTLFILATTTVNAHDPALHKKANAEKPNCEGMEGMDHSKMNMNDPIMQAMMTQCMGGDNHGGEHKTIKQGHGDMHKKGEQTTDGHKGDGHHGEMKKPH